MTPNHPKQPWRTPQQPGRRPSEHRRVRSASRSKVKRILSAGLSRVVIPIPSRAEQDDIVATLDAFDTLVNDLSIGLPAELTARRKQYEYYRVS